MRKLCAVLLMLAWGGIAHAENITSTVIDHPGVAVATQPLVYSGEYDKISVQVVYNDTVTSADTVSDGVLSSVTITVPATTTNINGSSATGTIHITDYTDLSEESVIVAGMRYTEGTDWDAVTSSATTATNLAAAINANNDVSAAATVSSVTVTARVRGEAGNSIGMTGTDTTNLTFSGTTLSGGINPPTITINGTTLTEGMEFDVVSVATNTAVNIATAIGAQSALSTLFSTATSGPTVTLTARTPGPTIYGIWASTTGLSISNWVQGADSDIDLTGNHIEESTHGFTTGMAVLYAKVSGTDPDDLYDGTTYYVVRLNNDLYQLATSTTNAVAGTEVEISTVAGGGSFTVTPLAFSSGTTAFYWEASNDYANWTDLTSVTVSSVSYVSDSSAIWNFGEYNYRYLRLNVVPPAAGGLRIKAILNGKK